MIVVTSDTIPGKPIRQVIAVVRGASVRALPISGDILSVMKNVVGGELEEYTKMGAEAREQAYDRMVAQAASLDANAVIAMRYGTAVVVDDK